MSMALRNGQVTKTEEVTRYIAYRISQGDNTEQLIYGLQCAFDCCSSTAEGYLEQYKRLLASLWDVESEHPETARQQRNLRNYLSDLQIPKD